MRILPIFVLASICFAATKPHKAKYKNDEWKPIFNGSTLEGWKANEHPESWTVKDGAIRGDGPASDLFYMGGTCVNCEFKAQVRINHGKSAMYFRAAFGPGSPKGYEALIDNTKSDPMNTGSLAGFSPIYNQLVQDDTWFTQHVIVDGNHIQIFVNEKLAVDFIDEQNTYIRGLLALQESQGSVVEFRNIMMKELTAPKSPLVGIWRLNREQSKFSTGEPPTQLEIRIEEERNGLRYQSASITADGQKHGANYFARPDGFDYRVKGSPDYNQVSLELTDAHYVHRALRDAKLRKKRDDHVYQVRTKMGSEAIGNAYYTVSPDGKTLTREGTTKHADGTQIEYKEVLDKVE